MKFVKLALANWKTSLAGIAAFLLSLPTLLPALHAWAEHQPVNWRQVTLSLALDAISVGLLHARDAGNQRASERSRASDIGHAVPLPIWPDPPAEKPGGPALGPAPK